MTMTVNGVVDTLYPIATHLAYVGRGVERVVAAPDEDRKLDYGWRDSVQTVLNALILEFCMRSADRFYTEPQLHRILELDKLQGLYGKPSAVRPTFNAVTDYPNLPGFLSKRLMGGSVRSSFNYLVPGNLELIDLPKMAPTEREKAQALVHHLKRRLNLKAYLADALKPLEEAGHLTEKQQGVLHQAAELYPAFQTLSKAATGDALPQGKSLQSALNTLQTPSLRGMLSPERVQALEGLVKEVKASKQNTLPAALASRLKDVLSHATEQVSGIIQQAQRISDGLIQQLPDQVPHFLEDIQKSHAVQKELKTLQISSGWPKLALNTLLFLMIYPTVGVPLDNYVIQPWSKKVVKERGDVSEVITAFGAGFGVWLATFGALMQKKFKLPLVGKALAGMNPVRRLVVSSLVSVGLWFGTAFSLMHALFQRPPRLPKNPAPPAPPLAFSTAIRHPEVFVPMEGAR